MLAALDSALLRLMRARGRSPGAERAVAAFSKLGEHGAIWFALAGAGALLDPGRRPAYAGAARTVAVAFVANQAVKQTVRRRRPEREGQLVGTPTQLSYPSTHACTSFAGAAALGRVIPAAPLYALAVPLALSRLYLGVHYPTDSLAGAVLGHAVAELSR
ncbi:MAG: phosphatase PAP2 family protein [Actinomycetota bacterium]|nr:phosphatase PAP2 family protein [Actinomycetota bacterium]